VAKIGEKEGKIRKIGYFIVFKKKFATPLNLKQGRSIKLPFMHN
jgi:hypothetical protein